MKQRLLNFLAVLSAVLCVAFVALWVRSFFRSDYVSHARFGRADGGTQSTQWNAATPKGVVVAGWRSLRLGHSAGPEHFRYGGWKWETHGPFDRRYPWGGRVSAANRLGFYWVRREYPVQNGYSENTLHVSFPTWSAVLLTALLPAARAWRRARRVPAGHCAGCGYDLRGNESGVCPECGRARGGAVRAGC